MKLILFNGPPGVGKTTVAKKVHEIMPMSFLLDLDLQKEFISQYKKYNKKSNTLSFEIALGIAETCMINNRDFISGKGMLDIIEEGKDKNILDQFIELGHKYKAEVYEIFLWADKETTLNRADERGYDKKIRDSIENTQKLFGHYWDEMDAYKNKRANAIIVDTSHLSVDEVFIKVKTILNHK